MITGRVVGNIFSTINHPFYDGKKLLVVEKTDIDGNPSKGYVIAVDAVDAGIGQAVIINDEGNGARQIYQSKDAPVRSVIVGIIDEIVT